MVVRTREARRHVHDALARIAATGLPAGEADPPRRPTFAYPAGGWQEALAAIDRERLTGLALEAVTEGRLHLTPAQLGQLAARHLGAMVRSLDHERALVQVVAALAEAGITAIVLKGPAFAHAFYADPSHRPFCDLDLLVATAAWRPACRVLEALGFARAQPEPRRGFDERFGKAATHRDRRGVTVDLHRTLVLGPYGLRLSLPSLLASAADLSIGGRVVQRLDDTASLLNACLHAAVGDSPPHLLALRDVAQIATTAAVDWDRLNAWADGWLVRAPVRYALLASSDRLGWPLPARCRALVRPLRRSEERLLAAHHGAVRDRGGIAVATLAGISGPARKGRYVWSLLVPSRPFIAARAAEGRGEGYRGRWRVVRGWLAAPRR